MAIINLAFEEIKANAADYQSKFALVDYVKRTTKEMIGTKIAEPIVPKYANPNEVKEEIAQDPENVTEKVSQEFTQKTDLLLDYIEKTYLAEGFVDTEEGKRVLAKMSMGGGQAPVSIFKKKKRYGLHF